MGDAFLKEKEHPDKSFDYMYIKEAIIIVINELNPPLMKTRK